MNKKKNERKRKRRGRGPMIEAIWAAQEQRNPKNAKKFIDHDNFNFIESNICNINDLDFDFKGFDTVVNFAAESHVDNSIRNPEKFINSNILGTSKVFQNSLENNIENNLHISTDEIYGSTVNKYFVEKN